MRREQRREQQGNSSVEMVLLLPVLLLLLFGGLEMARAASLRMALGDGAWRAARYLSIRAPYDDAGAAQIVRDAVAANALGSDPASVVVAVSDDGGRSFGNVVSVQAEAEFCPLIPFLAPGCIPLRVSHSLMVEAWP